jgi:hypothetical protein
MRFLMALGMALGAYGAIGIGAASPAAAGYDGPWCAQFWGGDTQYKNCSMRSFEMCLNEIRGTGGNTLCSPNPRFHPSAVEHGSRLRKPS